MSNRHRTTFAACGFALASGLLTALAADTSPEPTRAAPPWRTDRAWHAGKAEWALYDAQRVIYGKPRSYEATIFTDKELMDPATYTKTDDAETLGAFEVFKHNVSEIIPTENYTYRFLTTSYVRADTLEACKLTMSSQDDCGATYKQFLISDDGGTGKLQVRCQSFCYFPGAGAERDSYRRPGMPDNFRFHDDLSLSLRDYPFDQPRESDWYIKVIPDQTDNHQTPTRPDEARVQYVGKEQITVPYGTLQAHHLRVLHQPAGDTSQSDYWFAADPAMRHVLVKYEGPYGVRYELKKLAWWAYWKDPRPE